MDNQARLFEADVVPGAVVEKAVELGTPIKRIRLDVLVKEMAFVKQFAVPTFFRLIDEEALEPDDSPAVQFLLTDLTVGHMEDDDSVLTVVDRYAPKVVPLLMTPDEMSRRLQKRKHDAVWGKPYSEQTPSEYLDDIDHCMFDLAPRYFELFESGSGDAKAKATVRAALMALSPWKMPKNLNPVEAFVAMIPEVVSADIFESVFDWRRKGETLRNMKKNARRAEVRRKEREAREAANPKVKVEYGPTPTWEQLGVKVGAQGWEMAWKKPRRAESDKPLPVVHFEPMVIPSGIEAPALHEVVVRVPERCGYYVLREYAGRVFDVQFRFELAAGKDDEGNDVAAVDVMLDSIAIVADRDWNRTRIAGALRSLLRDDAAGDVFPVEIEAMVRVGSNLSLEEVEAMSSQQRELDAAVNADNGAGLSALWANA